MPARHSGVCTIALLVLSAVILAAPIEVRGAAGDLDPSFDGDGIRLVGGGDTTSGIALQADQRIVLGGNVFGADVVRLLPSGGYDPGFGVGGVAAVTLGSGTFDVRAVAVRADGRIVAGGQHGLSGTTRFGVVGLLADGTPDPGFGTGGAVLGPLDGLADAIIEQADGRIVLAGRLGIGSTARVAVVRYTDAGVADATFGAGGVVDLDLAVGQAEIFVDVVQDGAGRLVAVGSVSQTPGESSFVVARLDAAGVLDTSFGGTGVVLVDAGPGPDAAHAVALQADGAIVVVGNTGGPSLVMMRLLPNGTLDPSFGVGGITVSLVAGYTTIGRALALQADGRIVVAGTVHAPGNAQPAVARFLSDGTPDPSFGSGGAVVATLVNGGDVAEEGVAVQADGRILVSAASFFGHAVFRHLAGCGDGTLDPSEACDDGNDLSGDCCSPSCELEPPGSSCDDGIFCNGADVCDGLVCVHAGDPCVGGGECADACDEVGDACADAIGTPCTDDGAVCTRDECDGDGGCMHPPADGSPCDDGSACTDGDVCATGVCMSGVPITCPLCEACDAAMGCAADVRPSCRTGASGASTLLVKDAANDAADQIRFAWSRGAATTFAELGSPTTTDDQVLCVFDANDAVVLALAAPAGGTCGTKPCWKQLGSATAPKGFKYKDRDGLPHDVDMLTLKAGHEGKAAARVKARGANVPMSPLGGLSLPLRVQLQSAHGQCYAATFGTPSVHTAAQFKARSD